MRGTWIGAALVAAFALTAVGPSAAQQNPPAQPSIADPDQADQTAPPPKSSRRSRRPFNVLQPDLDSDDQLAPSQMKQPIPGAVAEPTGRASSRPTAASSPGTATARPVQHAEADTPPPPAAPAKKPAMAKPAVARTAFSPKGTVVSCDGVFGKDSSHLRLAMTYDSKNVSFADVDANNGSKVPASVVFPADPKRRLEIWWSNPAARSGTYLIDIKGKSAWSAPGGMKLGLTLAQLESLNHKPFKLKGFDKDGVATVSDWEDGALAALPGGCKSGVSLHADPKASPEALGAFAADQEFSSSDPALRAVKPAVSEILIGY
jgi:hypothetical protein